MPEESENGNFGGCMCFFLIAALFSVVPLSIVWANASNIRKPWSDQVSCKLHKVDISNSELCPSDHKFVLMVALLRTFEGVFPVRRAFEDASRKSCYSSSAVHVFVEKYVEGSNQTCWWKAGVNETLLQEGGYSEKRINGTKTTAVIWSSVIASILGSILILAFLSKLCS